jgi:S-formylglutathione hydrolase FrmB
MPAASLSYYTNMACGRDYFTFVAEELPELCRSFFPRLSADPHDNYIAGLSMGGYGAFKIALTHPERYAAACCLSAGNSIFDRRIPAFFDILRRNRTVFGVEDGQLLAGTKHDLYHLAEMASKGETTLPGLFHACGIEDFSYENAIELKDRMEAFPGDPFRYEFHAAPGSHTWEFWDEWIQVFLATIHVAPPAESATVPTLPDVGTTKAVTFGAAAATAARQG